MVTFDVVFLVLLTLENLNFSNQLSSPACKEI